MAMKEGRTCFEFHMKFNGLNVSIDEGVTHK